MDESPNKDNIEAIIEQFTENWNALFSEIQDPREYSAISYSPEPHKSPIGIEWKAHYHEPMLVIRNLPEYVNQKNIHFFGDNKGRCYYAIERDLFISGSKKSYEIASTTGYIWIIFDPEIMKFRLPTADELVWQSADGAYNFLETQLEQIRKDRTDFLKHFQSRLSSDGFTMPEMVTILKEFGRIKGYGPSSREIEGFKRRYR